ncbi:MAG: aminopeptidase P family protein [bacterium]
MFKRHRRALMEQMKDAVAVFFSARETLRNNDVHFSIGRAPTSSTSRASRSPSRCSCSPRTAGGRPDVPLPAPGAIRARGLGRQAPPASRPPPLRWASTGRSPSSSSQKLPGCSSGPAACTTTWGSAARTTSSSSTPSRPPGALRKRGMTPPGDVLDPAELLQAPPAQVARGHRANAAGRDAHRPGPPPGHGRHPAGPLQYQLQAAMEYSWRVGGARREAYPSIVGSGPNACVLHYRENNRRLEAGDLVLVDAGCEFGYHASDVTRTWPVNGRFSDPQRAIYEVVLNAQLAAIDHCRAGHAFDAVHQVAVRVLTEGMCDLGLLKGPVKERIEDEGYKRYYMHRTGHWLGMDVHDVGRYYLRGTSRALEPGMVLTVEPGIYIAPDDDQAPEAFRGIGVRIEDDVLVTEGAPRVLTDEAPKTVAEVEAVIGTADLPR